ncbi:MAG: hypothetical protein U1E56_05840 [Bauldia sp.]
MFPVRRYRTILALAAGAFLASQTGAVAAPVEDAVKAWVAAMDAAPGWRATLGTLTYDATSQEAVLKGLAVAAEHGDFSFAFGPVTIRGYSASPAGSFGAATIVAESMSVNVGVTAQVNFRNVRLDGVVIPNFAGVALDNERFFTSLVKIYGVMAKAKLDRGRVDEIRMLQDISGVHSEFAYQNVNLTRLADGKVDLFTAGPVTLNTPSPDGIAQFTAGKIEARGVDMGASVHVLDPDEYAGGVGDGQWRTALASAAYRDVVLDGPGLQFAMGDLTYENIRVRQPPRSFTQFFDQVFARPDMPQAEAEQLLRQHLANFLSSVAVGRVGLGDLDVAGNGNTRVRVGEVSLQEFSFAGLGEFRVSDVRVTSPDGGVSLERFAFGQMTFPSADKILAALQTDTRTKQSDALLQLVPHLGFVELLGLGISLPQGQASLDRIKLDLGGWIGPIPTAIAYDLRGLVLPLDKMELGEDLKSVLQQMGYSTISIDLGYNMEWREADETFSLTDVHVAARDIARFSADIELGGLPRLAIERPSILKDSFDHLLFRGLKITIEDSTLIDRSLAAFAQKLNLRANNNASFRQQFANALPFFLLFLKNGAFQAKIAPALRNFVLGPGTLVITAKPTEPVPLATILQMLDQQPQRVPDFLAIEVTTVR